MNLIEIIGYVAGILVALSLIPQVVKSWKTRSTKDISISWTFVYIFGLSFWIAYGLGIMSYPIIFLVTIEIILAISLLILKLIHG